MYVYLVMAVVSWMEAGMEVEDGRHAAQNLGLDACGKKPENFMSAK